MRTAEEQLEAFIDRYSPQIAERARSALARLRQILPHATRLVYDNYNALAVAFSPDDRPSHAVLSLTVYPRWVTLFLVKGAELSEASRLLKGGGNRMRHIVLGSADELDTPEIRALLDQAIHRSPAAMAAGDGPLIIQSVSSKQRPRRPGSVSKARA